LAQARKCVVSFVDREGKKHSHEVMAASTFEAVCRAWAQFRQSPESCELSFLAKEFYVDILQERRFVVHPEALLTAIRIGRRPDPRTLGRKKWLRKLLDEGLFSD
jgi:hypothetical protein